MKKRKAFLILGIIFAVLLGGFGITYLGFFGPFYVNLRRESIAQISFTHNFHALEKESVNDGDKTAVLMELCNLKYRRSLACKGRGNYTIRIEYIAGNAVEYDGYFFKRINAEGVVTKAFWTIEQNQELSDIYLKYFPIYVE